MRHVLYGQKSMLLDDDAAEALLAYAAHVSQLRTSDRVDMRGFTVEGNAVTTSFVLNGGTGLVAETTNLTMEEPDNRDAIAYIRKRIDEFSMNPDFFIGFQLTDEASTFD